MGGGKEEKCEEKFELKGIWKLKKVFLGELYEAKGKTRNLDTL